MIIGCVHSIQSHTAYEMLGYMFAGSSKFSQIILMYCVVAVKECHSHFYLTSPSLILKVSQRYLYIVCYAFSHARYSAEDVKTGSNEGGATPTKEAVQPPHHCLPTANNSTPPPLSAFYPHGYHIKVISGMLEK